MFNEFINFRKGIYFTKKKNKSSIPMHSYGHLYRTGKTKKIFKKYYIFLIEDVAESLGSFYKNKYAGTFDKLGFTSFNANKIITASESDCIIFNKNILTKKSKHLTVSAKILNKCEFNYDKIEYNYRMTNLNSFLKNKFKIPKKYQVFLEKKFNFFKELKNIKPNYWLNLIIFVNNKQREQFLKNTYANGIMTGLIWKLMNKLPMFKDVQCGYVKNSQWLEEIIVNIPSSLRV